MIFKTSIEIIVISRFTRRAQCLGQSILRYRVEAYLVCSRLLLGLLFIMSDEKLHGKLAREVKYSGAASRSGIRRLRGGNWLCYDCASVVDITL